MIKKIWQFFDGKKSKLALIYWTIVMPSLPVLWPDGVPTDVNKIVTIIGIALSSLGLGHAAIKAGSKK